MSETTAPSNTGPNTRDHGGGLDAAIARFGGTRKDWIDLSTGINPTPYPLPDIPKRFWQALPDSGDQAVLKSAARTFWDIPDGADIAAASGVSALIATLPQLAPAASVGIAQPTYNEHAASFSAFGWDVQTAASDTNVYVHPNNPDGRLWPLDTIHDNHKSLTIIDESFCDTTPDKSHIHLANQTGYVILKGLGKFWGLAGLRLGFAVARPETIAKLEQMLGPWAISGPAQHIGAAALTDTKWADATRTSLAQDADRLDQLMTNAGAAGPCGTTLFRTYHVANAQSWFENLAQNHILSRIFPFSDTMIRLGLPETADQWSRLTKAVE
jgi:cobalamin biosynthetic protein CobC